MAGRQTQIFLKPRSRAELRSEDQRLTSFLSNAEARRANMEEFLPPMTPDDLVLVGSRQLFDEIELKARDDYWQRFVPDFTGDRGDFVRRQLMAVTPIVVPDFDAFAIPRYTTDRKDDYIIHTALVSSAFAVVSDDRRHIAPDSDSPKIYAGHLSGQQVAAYQFRPFVDDLVNTLHFNLSDVDGSNLARAQHRVA
jgi:hypothetical protein